MKWSDEQMHRAAIADFESDWGREPDSVAVISVLVGLTALVVLVLLPCLMFPDQVLALLRWFFN